MQRIQISPSLTFSEPEITKPRNTKIHQGIDIQRGSRQSQRTGGLGGLQTLWSFSEINVMLKTWKYGLPFSWNIARETWLAGLLTTVTERALHIYVKCTQQQKNDFLTHTIQEPSDTATQRQKQFLWLTSSTKHLFQNKYHS